MRYSRREFAALTLAGLPAPLLLLNARLTALAAIESRINGVQIGAITYSFRTIPNAEDIIKAYQTIGLGEMELMANHAEALAGAPGGGGGGGRRGRGTPTPEEQAARDAAAKVLRDWRMSASAATFAPVRRKIEDAGIELRLLCYNMNVRNTKDDEIEYAFMMARWLGVKAISTSTQVSMAKRLAPFADKHKIMVGFHGHANTVDPDEVATPESFAVVMAASKYTPRISTSVITSKPATIPSRSCSSITRASPTCISRTRRRPATAAATRRGVRETRQSRRC